MPVINETLDSIIDLLGKLVSRPSQGGIDSPLPLLNVISNWLDGQGVAHHWLRGDNGTPLGVWGEIKGQRSGPTYLLNACADTAPFGERGAWRHPPDRPTIENGWMYGRGSADSKAGIAVFCHILADFLQYRESFAGSLGFVFDAEEHTGAFSGIYSYIATRGSEPIAGVMIGYPGNDRLVTGGRGFLRVRLTMHGIGAHSGASSNRGINAIERAAMFMNLLVAEPLPDSDKAFPLPPQITVTGLRGGGSYSLVPDHCELELDIRLTPAFNEDRARQIVENLVAREESKSLAPCTEIAWQTGWPAYWLDPTQPMVRALASAAAEAFDHDVPTGVVGPSSIANYLSTLGIPATAGLGVTYRNIHAPNECVRLDSLVPTFSAYRNALRQLLR
ncbi:MAG: M20 family metallopeptidase, partial [Zoogloeaceae bacterium]|uniref:M20 family metallopeptidase n=1 Tax=uncultured Zoogloea sp. TaxID=160237 RepID=UPI001A58F3D0|nr:M20 family metallopeptidase [uncultured Zoogloea sp.]MBL8447876.1 M20 family metallopeptidase [Zoogloeaceae bacterium]